MGNKTGISWTDSTWNPIRGCSRVSEGCRHCYAEGMAARFSKPGQAYEGLAVMQNHKPHWTGQIAFVEKHLMDPMRWGQILDDCRMCGAGPNDTCMHGSKASPGSSRWRPRRIFVNSMSDLFHENVTDEMRDKIFTVMALSPQHRFQVLTKRPKRMLEYLNGDWCGRLIPWLHQWQERPEGWGVMLETVNGVLPNVWLGVTVENQQAADERIPLLLQTPAAVRFLSCEPLLGEVNLEELPSHSGIGRHLDALSTFRDKHADIKYGIDWVIVGGESGPGARPMQQAWARSLRDQCESSRVPYFFKQWGEWVPTTDPKIAEARGIPLEQCMSHVGKHNAGSLLDGVDHKAFPAN